MDDETLEEALAGLLGEIQDRRNAGETPVLADYEGQPNEVRGALAEFFQNESFLEGALAPSAPAITPEPVRAEARLDLAAFPIVQRLPDVGLGTVHRLGGGGEPSELVVLRGWFTVPERERIAASAVLARRCDVPGMLRVLETGRLNLVPFVIRERSTGIELSIAIERLRDAGGSATLSDVLGEQSRAGHPPEPAAKVAWRLAASRRHRLAVARAVAAWAAVLHGAHESGHAHGEVTPRNLLLEESGATSVAGLGLGWAGTGIDPSRMRAWQGAWAAPELQNPRTPPTWLADIHALARCSLSLLVLEPSGVADGGDGHRDRQARQERILDQLPDVLPDAVESVLRAALTTDVEKRTATVSEFSAAFGRALQGPDAQEKDARLRRLRGVLIVLVVLLIAIFWFVVFNRS